MRNRAFTLVELLVVVAIIGLLMAMTIPAIMRVREVSNQLECKTKLKQIATSIHLFHNDYQCLPPKRVPNSLKDMTPDAVFSWRFFLLPYLEQTQLYTSGLRAYQVTKVTFQPPHQGYGTVVPGFICPTDSRLISAHEVEGVQTAFSSYLAVTGSDRSNGMFQGIRANRNFSIVSDGLSNTLMVGERPPPNTLLAGQWYSNYVRGPQPYLTGPNHSLQISNHRQNPADPCSAIYTFQRGRLDNPCDRYHFWSLHPGGTLFAFGDASVHFIPYSTDEKVMFALATCRGGEASIELE